MVNPLLSFRTVIKRLLGEHGFFLDHLDYICSQNGHHPIGAIQIPEESNDHKIVLVLNNQFYNWSNGERKAWVFRGNYGWQPTKTFNLCLEEDTQQLIETLTKAMTHFRPSMAQGFSYWQRCEGEQLISI